MLCLDEKFSHIDDCGTDKYITVEVNDYTSKLLKGRIMTNGEVIDETVINQYKESNNEVDVFSPITCNSPNGICKKCYGELYSNNHDYHPGVLSVLLLTNILTQLLLSSKHLMQIKTEKIDWPEEFHLGFIHDKASIISNGDLSKIQIKLDDIQMDDEGDNYIDTFTFQTGSSKVRKLQESPKKLFLSSEIMESIKDDDDYIFISRFKAGEAIFTTKTENMDISNSLKAFIAIIENPLKSKVRIEDDGKITVDQLSEYMNEVIDHLAKSNIKIGLVHVETIIRNLIYSYTVTNARPDYSVENPEVKIVGLSNAILGKSFSTGLAFEKVKQQLKSVSTYEKESDSILDGIFV